MSTASPQHKAAKDTINKSLQGLKSEMRMQHTNEPSMLRVLPSVARDTASLAIS